MFLCLVLLSERCAWQIAITMTCGAFMIDPMKTQPQFGRVAVGVTSGILPVAAMAALNQGWVHRLKKGARIAVTPFEEILLN